MMGSPEVVQEYRRRYERTPSVIASSMAGGAAVRPAGLVFIGTTSLYGQRPSQYDRISVPLGEPRGATRTLGASGSLHWKYLGRTLGMGTFQFGDRTVAQLALLLAQSRRGQKVNSVFGEGVNPRLRKIRDGLDELGLPTNELLNHGVPRLVYGLPLIRNLREYLLGIERTPRYIVDQRRGQRPGRWERPGRFSGEIIDWWRRWMLGRIGREDVLERMAGHRLIHPIRHGARVRLPRGRGGSWSCSGRHSGLVPPPPKLFRRVEGRVPLLLLQQARHSSVDRRPCRFRVPRLRRLEHRRELRPRGGMLLLPQQPPACFEPVARLGLRRIDADRQRH
jgi:hypothetical protein